MTTAIFCERMVLGRGVTLRLESAELRILGHDIIAVTPMSRVTWAAQPPAPGVERIDLGDRLLTPAFINGHTHLAMSAYRGVGLHLMKGNVVEDLYFVLEDHLEPGDVRAFARMGAYESLLSGVGCVWDHYYYGEALADALRDTGLSGVVAPTVQDLAGPAVGKEDAQLGATLAIAADDSLAADGIVAALGPHATDTVSEALWHRIGRLAGDYALPIHAHVAQTLEEFERSIERHGTSPVGWLAGLGALEGAPSSLLVHGLYLPERDLVALDPSRDVLGYCPFSQLLFGFPAHVDSWVEAGLSFTLGTDCGASNDGMNLQQELRLAGGDTAFAATMSAAHTRLRATASLEDARAVSAVRGEALSRRAARMEPAALLDAVWSVPGDMHPGLPLGELTVGRRANLAVWESTHPSFWPGTDPLRALAMGDVGGALHGMMVNGRWIGERGDYHRSVWQSDAYRASRREADERLSALLRRAGLDGMDV